MEPTEVLNEFNVQHHIAPSIQSMDHMRATSEESPTTEESYFGQHLQQWRHEPNHLHQLDLQHQLTHEPQFTVNISWNKVIELFFSRLVYLFSFSRLEQV